jgi:glycosyltransferase involved in cell wall biosynthesis
MKNLMLDLASEPDVVAALKVAEQLRMAAPMASTSGARLLVDAVSDEDPLVAIGSIHALAATSISDVDDTLIAGLHDARPYLREHAAWALSARPLRPRAVPGLVALHSSESDLSAMVAQRTLVGWADADPIGIGRVLANQLRWTADEDARRRLVDTLGQIPSAEAHEVLLAVALDRSETVDVRSAAVGAFVGTRDPAAHAALLAIADESSAVAISALLALFDPVPIDGDTIRPRGLRVGQISLTGELDGRLSQAGAGDTGGIASLLVSLSHTLAGRDSVESVVSIGRSSPDGELSSLLLPDFGAEGFSSISLGPIGRPPALASEWDYRLMVERGIGRALARRPSLDVLHLRMADVGTLAAASIARRLGIPVVFTCAPDPHGPIAQRQASGAIDRDNFGQIDFDEHLWFRARMAERLVLQADHLVLFPRLDVRNTIERVLGIDREFLDRRSTVAAEGIDLAAIDAAFVDRTAPAVLGEIATRLPPERHGLSLVVSVGRLHPAKGMTRVVRDWLNDERLTASTNLAIVGGDLVNPNPAERRILDDIVDIIQHHPHGNGVVLLGAREPSVTAQVLVAAVRGDGNQIAPGGIYVNGAAKEEFGLAVLEALAAGLPVVAPREGGPSTYVEHDTTGVLVAPTADLGPAMVRAMGLHEVPGRAAAARKMIEDRYTIDAYADSLLGAYDSVAAAARH